MQASDDGEGDPDRDPVSGGRSPAPNQALERRLQEVRESGLPDPAQGERRHGDTELARGDVRVQMPHDLLRERRAGMALAGELLEAGPAHRDDGELGRDEEAVRQDQDDHRREPERGRPVHLRYSTPRGCDCLATHGGRARAVDGRLRCRRAPDPCQSSCSVPYLRDGVCEPHAHKPLPRVYRLDRGTWVGSVCAGRPGLYGRQASRNIRVDGASFSDWSNGGGALSGRTNRRYSKSMKIVEKPADEGQYCPHG